MIGVWSGRTIYCLALILVVAGLTHLSAVLVLPGRSHASAYAALATALKGTTLKTMAGEKQPAAFTDPAFPNAACLYDLRDGPVSMSLAVTPDQFVTLSVHDRHGRLLAGLTSRSARNGRLGLTIIASNAAPLRRSSETTSDSGISDIRVEATEPLGFVLAEVLATEPSEQISATATAGALSCRPSTPESPGL